MLLCCSYRLRQMSHPHSFALFLCCCCYCSILLTTTRIDASETGQLSIGARSSNASITTISCFVHNGTIWDKSEGSALACGTDTHGGNLTIRSCYKFQCNERVVKGCGKCNDTNVKQSIPNYECARGWHFCGDCAENECNGSIGGGDSIFTRYGPSLLTVIGIVVTTFSAAS